MQQFKSIKKIQLTIVNLILIGSVSADSIGSIIEQSGAAQIKRQQDELVVTAAYLPEIELNDITETGMGKLNIQFLDKAQLDIKEFLVPLCRPGPPLTCDISGSSPSND